MSINFTNQTVSINTVLSFGRMSTLQELLEMAAMEAGEASDAGKTVAIASLADSFGIVLDVDSMESSGSTSAADNAGNDQLPSGLPGASEEDDIPL